MAVNSGKSIKANPWGDDNPEKLKRSPTKTIGWGQQLKGLFNPDSFLTSKSGETGLSETPKQPKIEQKPAKSEILVFSRTAKESEQKLYQESAVILQKLKEQVVILEKSNKNLVSELSKVKVEHVPQKSGIYYIRFLEWLLIIVRQMRVKVEEGRAWLETFAKRKKKLGYWKMYKKHGTTFGLSQERTLATQTG